MLANGFVGFILYELRRGKERVLFAGPALRKTLPAAEPWNVENREQEKSCLNEHGRGIRIR